MVNYPKITDVNIIDKVDREFKKYRFKPEHVRKPQRELCTPPSDFKLQLPQRFVRDFMNPTTKYTGLLVYHQIGSGKSCTAIQVTKPYVGKRHIYIVLPAFLENNIRDELYGPCGGYGEEFDDQAVANKQIDRDYTVLSYHKFVAKLESKKIRLDRSLIVIDEVQNIVSETGKFYSVIRTAVEKAKDVRVLLLSATPIFDQPHELAKTLNLIPRKQYLPEGPEFDKEFLRPLGDKGVGSSGGNGALIDEYTIMNRSRLGDLMRGYISYYKGMPAKTFPTATIKHVFCHMETFQYKSYQAVVTREQKLIKKHSELFKMPTNFFIGSRMISNIAYPNRKASSVGYADFVQHSLQRKDLKRYSIKFYKLLGKLRKLTATKGNAFVYSNFVEFGGLYPLRACLLANGWYDFVATVKAGEPVRRTRKYFAMWTSNENNDTKQLVRTSFNDASHPVRLILGSPSLREGVSLLRVRQVHILEPYWNMSRLEQVMGRAIRFCSHASLPRAEQTVDVFIYLAVRPKELNISRDAKERGSSSPLDIYSVDRYIMELAHLKSRVIREFTDVMKSTAIDCKLNLAINNEGKSKKDKIVCDSM